MDLHIFLCDVPCCTVNPDPKRIRIQQGHRIQVQKPDPDPGSEKMAQKCKKRRIFLIFLRTGCSY
jgi:hypothetical protein